MTSGCQFHTKEQLTALLSDVPALLSTAKIDTDLSWKTWSSPVTFILYSFVFKILYLKRKDLRVDASVFSFSFESDVMGGGGAAAEFSRRANPPEASSFHPAWLICVSPLFRSAGSSSSKTLQTWAPQRSLLKRYLLVFHRDSQTGEMNPPKHSDSRRLWFSDV